MICIAGIGLLALVFVVAYHMLTSPVPGLREALSAAGTKSAGSGQQPLVGGAAAVLSFLLRLAVLFVMTLAASLIAARGIHLYFAAIGSGHGSVAPAGDHTATARVEPDPHRTELNGSQSATPAVSSGNRAPREVSSKREAEGGAPAGEAAGPRQ